MGQKPLAVTYEGVTGEETDSQVSEDWNIPRKRHEK